MVTVTQLAGFCQRRGFIYPGSQIYGGLAGTWDYGPLGVELKRNLIDLWWRRFVRSRSDIYGLDSAILMNRAVWVASGHTDAGFSDPLVEDQVTGERYRADHLLEAAGVSLGATDPKTLNQLIKDHDLKSPAGNRLSEVRDFNMMFQTNIGAAAGTDQTVYIRPETAQGMFVNFKNIIDSQQPDLPFGIAQVGKAFRNEISPRDFIFRSREFEQMEIEYFCRPEAKPDLWQEWRQAILDFLESVGIGSEMIGELEISPSERAHYSQKTVDFVFEFSFGRQELCGLADRGDYDLKNHQTASGKSLEYISKTDAGKIQPHCLEPTFGLDRLILAILTAAYRTDQANDRVYLALSPALAPVRYAVSPLLKNRPEMVKTARRIYDQLKDRWGQVAWDDHGNIGKRYRRQDEIGTPACIVIDHQTLDDGTVTSRDRDSLKQVRVRPESLLEAASGQ